MIFPYARRESGARETHTHTRTRSNAHTLLYLVLHCLNLQCVSVRITCQCTIKRAEDPRHVLHHRNIDLRGTCSLNLKHAVCVCTGIPGAARAQCSHCQAGTNRSNPRSLDPETYPWQREHLAGTYPHHPVTERGKEDCHFRANY